jgi:hypothetical protein
MADGTGWADACDGAGAGFDAPPEGRIEDRADCLIQLLAAYRDIADFDDIHQAAERLAAVADWIRREARAAAADPLFNDAPALHPAHATA